MVHQSTLVLNSAEVKSVFKSCSYSDLSEVGYNKFFTMSFYKVSPSFWWEVMYSADFSQDRILTSAVEDLLVLFNGMFVGTIESGDRSS